MRLRCQFILAAAGGLLVAGNVFAAKWVDLVDETNTRLISTAHLIDHDNLEKDLAVADYDNDGDLDLAVARKFPGSVQGGFPNQLFLNEGGVLVDRTVEYATDSDAPNSQGFLDATNDRRFEAVDVNNDGWIDLVTATTLSDQLEASPWIGQPRVYMNKGADGDGNWLGFKNEDARIPVLKSKSGTTANPRFCDVCAVDVNMDGYMDLYFTDYDTQETSGTVKVDLNQDGDTTDPGESQGSPGETGSKDYDDKLLINRGLNGSLAPGFFEDSTTTIMTATQLSSGFGQACKAADMNNDGIADIVKVNTLGGSGSFGQSIACNHNDPNNPGTFTTFNKYFKVQGLSPYNIAIDDLNNDGNLDILVADDGIEYWQQNNGPGANGFSDSPDFTKRNVILGGSQVGFTNTCDIADMDNDGWKDGFVADVDADLESPFCPQNGPDRLQIYHNEPGTGGIRQLKEIGSADAVIPFTNLYGSFDVAPFDINGDGWLDLVIARCAGVYVYMNQPKFGLQFAFPGGLPSLIVPDESAAIQVDITTFGGATMLAGSATFHYAVNGGAWNEAPMSSVGGNTFEANLPASTCNDVIAYYFSAKTEGDYSGTFYSPYDAPGVNVRTVAVADSTVVTSEAFEGDTSAWTVSNTNVASGGWLVQDPKPTTINAKNMSPNDDASAVGTMAFMTSANGSGADGNDLDGGPTVLTSPAYDINGKDAVITYSRYFRDQNNGNGVGNDQFVVEVSSNGSDWVNVETVEFAPAAWVTRSFRVSDYVTPSANVQVRFTASDSPNNSITVAGVDEFSVAVMECAVEPVCAPDLNGDLMVDGADLGLLLANWNNSGVGDLNGDNIVDGADLGLVLAAWGACQ